MNARILVCALGAAVMISGVGACGSGNDGAKRMSSAGEVASAAQQARTHPGALTKPIDQYSGAELFALARRLRFVGGNERSRRCRENDRAGGAQSTSTRVDAVDGEDSLSAAAVPANGVIVAKAGNRGQRTERMYAMRSGSRYEYYLIVLPGARGTATWRLEELDTTSAARAHRSIATGPFTECHHTFSRGARADFKTCAQAAALHTASLFSLPMPMQGIDPPIWVACASGCCTADPGGGGNGDN